MNPKDLTEFGRREAMSHNNNTNDTQSSRARKIQPYKYSDDVAMIICTYLRKGCTIEASCQAANIGRATYYRWLEEIPEIGGLPLGSSKDVILNDGESRENLRSA